MCVRERERERKRYSPSFPSSSGESIRVFVRVRPPDPNLSGDLDHAHCLNVTSATSVTMQSRPEPRVFTFDHVAGMNTTQVNCDMLHIQHVLLLLYTVYMYMYIHVCTCVCVLHIG